MQSLFNLNVIKHNNVVPNGSKAIKTHYFHIPRAMDNEVSVSNENQLELREEEVRKTLENYENLARTMLENARKQSEVIMSKAYEEAQKIEREAYARGYNCGKEQGYQEAYEETIGQASQQAEMMLENSSRVLMNAKAEYENYITAKQKDIVDLSINIAETVLKKELVEKGRINEMVYEVLNDSRNAESYILKVNSVHYEELKSRVSNWKERLAIKGDIFVIADDFIEPGNAEIEKNSGKVVVGLNVGMECVREALI